MSEDKNAAVKAEATDQETVTVKWRDLEFEVPTDRDEWSFEAHLAIEEQNYFIALKEFLPPASFAKFRSSRPKGRDSAELFRAVAVALGMIDAGESSASSE